MANKEKKDKHTYRQGRVGCKIGTLPTNIFVYADDIVLLCPSWYAMKVLLSLIHISEPTRPY